MQRELDMNPAPAPKAGPSLDDVRALAQKDADQNNVVMVIGWTVENDDGRREYGYCPAYSAGPGFVVEVLETIPPYRGGRADYAQRQEARRDRLETAAERQARESSQRFKRARAAVDGIPFGQPILVGHHSERRHRGALAKHDTNMRAAFAADERAKELAGRANSVGTAGVSSDDPEALQKLRKEFADLDKIQATMKSANAAIRQHKKNPEACVAALCEIITGLKPAGARKLMEPDDCGRIGFADYQLQNNNANMRRILKRIVALQTVATVPEGERARSKSGVIFQVADNRVQLLFPGKPSEFIRDHLKSKGFRWARSAGAWQRHLNAGGINVAGDVIEWLDKIDIQEGR